MSRSILHVSESNEWSGGAAQLLALTEGLRARGWTVAVACRPGSGLEQRSKERGLETFPVALSEDYDLISAWKLARFVAARGFSAVHAHHNRSHAVCLLAKALLRLRGGTTALVVSRRVSFAPGRNPFSRWKYRSALIDRIVAVADAVKEVLVAAGVPAERVSVIRSGVDLERFAPRAGGAELKKRLGLPEGVALVGKIANASPWKGQTVLLEAAALLAARGAKAHFVLAGRDTDGEWVRAEIARLGLETRVSALGFRTDVPDILSCLDLSVNAAVRGEGLSGALRESLAMGVPVIASDIAGNRELLGSEGGRFLYPPGDAAALAERLSWALAHRDEARAAAATWREKAAAEFGSEQSIAKHEALYTELIS